MNIYIKLITFIFSWIIVKVSCIDAGGVILALSSGIIFDGIIQGAIISSFSATIGSYVAFTLAKLNTPIRTKALELLDEYPSLRGIDKVVSKDGLKAVLTLRLAPILPIPIGFYNYIYGVTNVPVTAFLGGIFLGSLKPYFLDSYLGYFGKDIIQGNVDTNGIQDALLITALGISVLIGVFASQLASETWDTVLEEIELEKKQKLLLNNTTDITTENDGIVRKIFDMDIPKWIIGFQLALKDADKSINDVVLNEQYAKVWNYTNVNDDIIPYEINPVNYITSPEIVEYNKGINLVESLCEGLVLSPIMFTSFLKYSNPLYNETIDEQLIEYIQNSPPKVIIKSNNPEIEYNKKQLLLKLNQLRIRTENRINILNERI